MKILEVGMEAKNKMFSTGRNVYLAGLGVAATITDQYGRVYGDLVEKGRGVNQKSDEEKTENTSGLAFKANEFKGKVEARVQDGVSGALGRFGIPSQKEISDLTKSIEILTEKVQNLQTKGAA